MTHYLNVCDIDGSTIEPVDIITFGSPCQDMSVAGKRAGLDGSRSNLFYEAIRIIKEMRCATNGKYPRYIVWENVPGAFSSNKGHDFHAVLEAVCQICDTNVSIPKPCDKRKPDKLAWNKAGHIVGSGYSVAWRTLDAQYWGVPQRRKRVFLIADFGGQRAGEILFKPDGLPRDTAESREARERVTTDAERGVAGGCGAGCIAFGGKQQSMVATEDCANTLSATDYKEPQVVVFSAGFCTEHSASARGIGYEEEVSPTLRAGVTPAVVICADKASTLRAGAGAPKHMSDILGRLVVENALPFNTTQITSPHNGNNPKWGDPCHCLASTDHPPTAVVCLNDQGGSSINVESGNTSPTLRANSHQHEPVIALQANCIDRADTAGCNGAGWREGVGYILNTIDRHAVCYPDVTGTLCASGAGLNRPAWQGNETDMCVVTEAKSLRKYIIRRLTPLECCRLQGFPDGWADLPTITEMTDNEYFFWSDVLETKAKINGKAYKQKTKAQMIKWYNKLHTDSAEYKMWGNGVALPNARYVLSGITEQDAKTLGSLFDGSGGFPLAGMLEGITPLWCSEIEPYPIAVTLERFKNFGKEAADLLLMRNGRNDDIR